MSAPTSPEPTQAAPEPALTPHAEYRARKYFGEIDGLRSLAIAAVVWNHSRGDDDTFGWGLGVKLFFVISGFLITTLLLREQSKTGTISLTGFYTRRSLRIFPLYFGVLALYALLVVLVERGSPAGRQFFGNLPYFLSFTANWFVAYDLDERVIFYFAWSLSAQEQFYTIWPAIVRYARRWWTPVALMAATVALSAAVGWGLETGRLERGRLLYRIVSGFPTAIGAGFLAAYLLHREGGFRLVYPLLRWRWAAPLGLLLMLAEGFYLELPDVIPVAGALLLVTACAVRPRNPLSPLLDLALLRHVGTVSLGVYLLHMLVVSALHRFLPDPPRWIAFPLVFPLTVAAATLSYRYFETPFMRLKRRAPKAPARPVTTLPSAPREDQAR